MNDLPSHERPDKDLLDNDAELDRWWEAFVRRIASESARMARGASRGGPSTDIPVYGAEG